MPGGNRGAFAVVLGRARLDQSREFVATDNPGRLTAMRHHDFRSPVANEEVKQRTEGGFSVVTGHVSVGHFAHAT